LSIKDKSALLRWAQQGRSSSLKGQSGKRLRTFRFHGLQFIGIQAQRV